MRPVDIYSGTKVEAEEIVRSSSLEWVVLRFGGVLSTDLVGDATQLRDAMFFARRCRADNRVQTVDVRDVAWACAAATTADVARRDPADRRRRVTPPLVRRHRAGTRRGRWAIPGAIPPGRPGNPDSDTDWFVTDWMDTTRAQEALKFQHYSWSGHDGRNTAEVLVEALSGAADRADRSRGR